MTEYQFEIELTNGLVKDFLGWHLRNFPNNKWNYLYFESRKNIILNVHAAKYDTLMYLYGKDFLLKLMEFFKERELYERCQQIIDSIESHNELINDNIPTSYL